MAKCSGERVLYLHRDPLVSGEEVQSAALKRTENEALIEFSCD